MVKIKTPEWIKEVYFSPCDIQTDESGLVLENYRNKCSVWMGGTCEKKHLSYDGFQWESLNKSNKLKEEVQINGKSISREEVLKIVRQMLENTEMELTLYGST